MFLEKKNRIILILFYVEYGLRTFRNNRFRLYSAKKSNSRSRNDSVHNIIYKRSAVAAGPNASTTDFNYNKPIVVNTK